jgi:hypothetical protein
MGTMDLSEVRANIVQKLNAHGIPVVAWLLLPKDQGYWMNMDNYLNVTHRYREVRTYCVVKNNAYQIKLATNCFGRDSAL